MNNGKALEQITQQVLEEINLKYILNKDFYKSKEDNIYSKNVFYKDKYMKRGRIAEFVVKSNNKFYRIENKFQKSQGSAKEKITDTFFSMKQNKHNLILILGGIELIKDTFIEGLKFKVNQIKGISKRTNILKYENIEFLKQDLESILNK